MGHAVLELLGTTWSDVLGKKAKADVLGYKGQAMGHAVLELLVHVNLDEDLK